MSLKEIIENMKSFHKSDTSRDDVVRILQGMLDDTLNEWDWDDFISIPIKDVFLDKIRIRCDSTRELFPPSKVGEWCNEQGLEEIRSILKTLKDLNEQI
jgi:hypothetical protein